MVARCVSASLLAGILPISSDDIWRIFVAQRIAWTNDWTVLFHEPTNQQERNEHDLMLDFKDEVPGYLNNKAICEALGKLELNQGLDYISDNLRVCYEELVRRAARVEAVEP